MHVSFYKIFLFTTLIAVSGCSGTKALDEPAFSQWDTEKPHLVFANFKLEKQNGKVIGELMDKSVVAGSLKKGMEDHKEKTIRFTFLDLNQKPIGIGGYADNPLSSVYEYADDKGNLMKQRIESDSGTLSTRLLLPGDARYLSVELMEESGTYKEIIRTSI